MNTLFFHHNHALFQSAKVHLEDVCKANYVAHAKNLDFSQTISYNPCKQAELCCMIMDHILTNATEYDATGYIPREVQEHTVQMLQKVPHPDAIYGLLEDLALITRGHTLFAHKSNGIEQTFLQAFENAGEWNAGDGNLVSDWYWLRLPTLAINHEHLAQSAR